MREDAVRSVHYHIDLGLMNKIYMTAGVLTTSGVFDFFVCVKNLKKQVNRSSVCLSGGGPNRLIS